MSCAGRVGLFWLRVVLRLIQFCSSLVAYIALRTAGVSYHNTVRGQTVAVVVSSSIVSFTRIVNFLVFLYAFAFLVCVEWLRLCVHPVHYCEKVMDMMWLALLTTATLILLLSGITLHCRSEYGLFVKCGGIYLALAASFLSILAFLAIVLIGTSDDEGQRRDEREGEAYSGHGTPRAGATPVPVVSAQAV
ncbi:hypothetical protein PHMEG_00023264 [Phytophthora megakarya]|uniref:MARVEL domain-containing protein n=1 Tax=Phytophthora megakarya TaxID=4795 RepID=A0A225VGS9_9STRA|nr:hypothetical protein PHMEG_00023264 [Phytophthora megakarya]